MTQALQTHFESGWIDAPNGFPLENGLHCSVHYRGLLQYEKWGRMAWPGEGMAGGGERPRQLLGPSCQVTISRYSPAAINSFITFL